MEKFGEMDRYAQFDRVFWKYYDRLFHHAYSFLRQTENAHDVVNDTFEIIWKDYGRYAEHPNPASYLYAIVRHKCLDALRRRAIHDRYVDAAKSEPYAEAYDYTDYEIKMEAVKNRIAAFPPRTRKVFILCYIDGYTYRQAARQLGVSVNTVKTTLSRALKTLRETFDRDNRSKGR
ncbi:MAG: sigma-70 family RNA polymerase sigma factor [Rikenellaceae bacterium]|nr:sigma-70 family RNA polymerase sigma factor [Rikenellaceae bacterium]